MRIDGRVVNDVPARDRGIAMVFQNYALYPHMSVYDNMAFGLRRLKVPRPEIDDRVRRVAEILAITPLLDRKPKQLSGGQQQRVAMGRAMIKTPKVFLFDEPLSNLDAMLRDQLRIELKKLHQLLKATIVFVTHDQLEAMTLADKIAVMKDGVVEQVGTPTEVYHAPASLFVARFIGSPAINLVPMRVSADGRRLVGDAMSLALGSSFGTALTPGRAVTLGIRPKDLRLPVGDETDNRIAATVVLSEMLGAESLMQVRVGDQELAILVRNADARPQGSRIEVVIPVEALFLFDAETTKRIDRAEAPRPTPAPAVPATPSNPPNAVPVPL